MKPCTDSQILACQILTIYLPTKMKTSDYNAELDRLRLKIMNAKDSGEWSYVREAQQEMDEFLENNITDEDYDQKIRSINENISHFRREYCITSDRKPIRDAISEREAFIEKYAPKSFKLEELHNINIDGVDNRDYPDFSDAFLQDAMYEGRWLSERQVELINDNHSDWVHEHIFGNIDSYMWSDEDH